MYQTRECQMWMSGYNIQVSFCLPRFFQAKLTNPPLSKCGPKCSLPSSDTDDCL